MSSSALLFPKHSIEPLEQDSCTVPQEIWLRWVNTQSTEVLCVTVKQFEDPVTLVVSGGHTDDDTTVYLPAPLMMGMQEDEYCSIRVVTTLPPVATKVVLQPLDNELYHCDIGAAVSKKLSNWHLLRKNQTLTVECEELGGFPVDVFIKDVEPAETVLLRGEVPLELAESLEEVVEWSAPAPSAPRPSTPAPAPPEDFASMFSPPQPSKTGFQPFSGTGHRLG